MSFLEYEWQVIFRVYAFWGRGLGVDCNFEGSAANHLWFIDALELDLVTTSLHGVKPGGGGGDSGGDGGNDSNKMVVW